MKLVFNQSANAIYSLENGKLTFVKYSQTNPMNLPTV